MSGHLDIWSSFGSSWYSIRCTPSRGIRWQWMVLYQVILTFGHPVGQADIQSDVALSRGFWCQEQYYIRSSWQLVILLVRLTFSQMYLLGRGIWWPRMVLHQVVLIFGHPDRSGWYSVIHTPQGRGHLMDESMVLNQVIWTFGSSFGSSWHSIRCTPCTGNWSPRIVQCQGILTFGHPMGQADI